MASYGLRNFCGNKVYYEPKYPNILFAIDGEVYNFDGKEYLIVGGAHSIDKIKFPCGDYRESHSPPALLDRKPHILLTHRDVC